MPFISSSEVKNVYFMNFLFIIYNFTDFCAVNGVIYVCTLCHINDDVA